MAWPLWIALEGMTAISPAFISLNKSNTLLHIIIYYKYNSEFGNGFEFVDITIE